MPIDNCVQVFISLMVAAIVHSNYISKQPWLLSTYVYISVRYASHKFLNHYKLHNFPIVSDVHRRARTKLQWQTLQHLLDVFRSLAILDLCSDGTWTATGLPRHCEGHSLQSQFGTYAFIGVPGCRIDTKSKKNVFIRTSGCQKRHLTMLAFCCTNNRIIISFLRVQMNQSAKMSIFSRKRGVYELIGCTNCQKFYGTLVDTVLPWSTD